MLTLPPSMFGAWPGTQAPVYGSSIWVDPQAVTVGSEEFIDGTLAYAAMGAAATATANEPARITRCAGC